MGNMIEYVKMAIHNILANKGRSFLTMLGIIIGISSVIAIVSIGQGTTNQMNSEINDVGVGQIYINCSEDAQKAEEWITPDDLEDLKALDEVDGVSVASTLVGETTTGKGNFSLYLTGDTEDAKMVNNDSMKRGNYFTDADVAEARNVCVISDMDAKRLFGTDDVVGMDIDVTSYDITKTYRIVGVTEQKENGTFVSYTYEGMPSYITVPYTSLSDVMEGIEEFYSVTIIGNKSVDSKVVTEKALHVLERNHQSAGEDLSGTEFSRCAEGYEPDDGNGDSIYLLCGWNFFAGRRYRSYEYYVGVCHGAYPRDRYSKISGRKNFLDYDAILGGIGDYHGDWRYHRNCSRHCSSVWDMFDYQSVHGDGDFSWHQPGNDIDRDGVCLRSRSLFWNLSG